MPSKPTKPAPNAAYYFFPRDSEGQSKPAGYTVSKRPALPQGDTD